MAIQSKEISRRDFLRVGLVGLGLAAVGGAAKTIDILSGPNPISSSAAAREKTSGKMLAKEVTIKAGDLSFVINSDRFQNREDFTRVTDETGFVSQKYQDAFGPPLKRRKVLVADKVFDPQHKERPYGAYSFVDHNIFSDQEFQGNIFLSEDKIRGDGLKESLGCEIAHFWDWPNPEKNCL